MYNRVLLYTTLMKLFERDWREVEKKFKVLEKKEPKKD